MTVRHDFRISGVNLSDLLGAWTAIGWSGCSGRSLKSSISRVQGAILPWGQLRELTSQAPQGSHPSPLTSSVSVISCNVRG